MSRLYLVRHGQTPCNHTGVLCGSGCDTPLNATGNRMAQALATRFKDHRFAVTGVSPLVRARQSLAPLAQVLHQTPVVLSGLTELNYGELEGSPADAAPDAGATAHRAFLYNPFAHPAPGGESGQQVLTRARNAIGELLHKASGGDILVMSHKCTLRLLLCHFLGIDGRHFKTRLEQPSGGISVVSVTAAGVRLQSLGEVGYLTDAGIETPLAPHRAVRLPARNNAGAAAVT